MFWQAAWLLLAALIAQAFRSVDLLQACLTNLSQRSQEPQLGPASLASRIPGYQAPPTAAPAPERSAPPMLPTPGFEVPWRMVEALPILWTRGLLEGGHLHQQTMQCYLAAFFVFCLQVCVYSLCVCVSAFVAVLSKISYTSEQSGDLNRAKLWGGKEVPRETYIWKVDEVCKGTKKNKGNLVTIQLCFFASGGRKLSLYSHVATRDRRERHGG